MVSFNFFIIDSKVWRSDLTVERISPKVCALTTGIALARNRTFRLPTAEISTLSRNLFISSYKCEGCFLSLSDSPMIEPTSIFSRNSFSSRWSEPSLNSCFSRAKASWKGTAKSMKWMDIFFPFILQWEKGRSLIRFIKVDGDYPLPPANYDGAWTLTSWADLKNSWRVWI